MSSEDPTAARAGSGSAPRPSATTLATAFVASFVVLGSAAARDVTLVDSGELILASVELDVAHPPGFPVYVLLGHLFSLLPVGTPAFRLSLLSAFFGALTAALLAAFLARSARSRLDELVCVGTAVAFALSSSHGAYAVVAEVYTLNLALFVAVLGALWGLSGDDPPRRLVGIGLGIGLGLGVHHVSWVWWAPGFLILLAFPGSGPRQIDAAALVRRCGAVGAGVVAGLSAYAYLPLAASRTPWLNWGGIHDPWSLWWHVSAGQYRAYLGQGSLEIFWDNLGELAALWTAQLTPVGAVLALYGAWILGRRRPAGLVALVSGCAGGVLYAAWYDIAEDGDAYYLPTFLVTALLCGVALLELARSRRRLARVQIAPAAVAATVAVGLAVFLGVENYADLDRSADRTARHFAQDVMADVDPGGLVLTRDWQFHAPFLYLHRVEGFRADAAVVNLNLLRYSWYLDHLDRAAPELAAACDAERRAYAAAIAPWERGEPHDPDALTAAYRRLIEAMIAHTLARGREVHLTVPVEPGIGTGYAWIPRALTFRLHERPPAKIEPLPPTRRHELLRPHLQDVARTKVRGVYAFLAEQRALYLERLGFPEDARASRDAAEALRRAP